MKKRIFLFCLCLIFVFPLASVSADQINNLKDGLATISGEDVYSYCKTMAEPRFAGRYTGHEGYTAAAEWAAGLFKSWGLRPVSSEAGYLQAYPSPYVIVNEAEMALEIDGKTSALKPGPDFLPLLFSDSGDHTAELVFAGWGISAPELGYDDYEGIDVGGRFVVCFRGTPDPREEGFVKHDHHRFRMQSAKDRGALGLFYIYESPLANPNGDWIKEFTPAILSEKTADRFLAEKGLTSSDLRAELRKTKKPHSFHLRSKARFRVDASPHPEGTGYNVVGYIEGSDPELKKECLVIGGHFDHCGLHMGMLYPGANDNASGSAVVMEVGQAFASLKEKPKRSVLFVLFGGEEMGLQGSTYFAEHLPAPFTKIAFMFNFDMVGEGDGVRGGISPEPKELKEMLEKADKSVGILRGVRFFRGGVGVRGSDFAPFYEQGIPCASFSSNGPHLFYHLPGDTIYRINPDVMADISRLAFLAAYSLADL